MSKRKRTSGNQLPHWLDCNTWMLKKTIPILHIRGWKSIVALLCAHFLFSLFLLLMCGCFLHCNSYKCVIFQLFNSQGHFRLQQKNRSKDLFASVKNEQFGDEKEGSGLLPIWPRGGEKENGQSKSQLHCGKLHSFLSHNMIHNSFVKVVASLTHTQSALWKWCPGALPQAILRAKSKQLHIHLKCCPLCFHQHPKSYSNFIFNNFLQKFTTFFFSMSIKSFNKAIHIYTYIVSSGVTSVSFLMKSLKKLWRTIVNLWEKYMEQKSHS